MEFGEKFEREFVSQGMTTNRSIEETLDLGWDCLRLLPREELHRVTEEELVEYYDSREEVGD